MIKHLFRKKFRHVQRKSMVPVVTAVKQMSLQHNKGAEVGNKDRKHVHNQRGLKALAGPMCLSELILQTITIHEK
jgi:hypothetical protein